MTDTEGLSDCDKTMNADEPIYGDLITEIDLEEDVITDDKQKDQDITDCDLVNQNNDPVDATIEIPTEPDSYVTSDVLSQDDAVSDFFAVDSKTDEFDSEMLIGELDDGIDFKNETDVAECHHEYESKKLLFEGCEDIVEVTTHEITPTQEDEEVAADGEDTIVIDETATLTTDEPIDAKTEDNAEDTSEACFDIADEESLNRMHVMEDVEEGCDVSGALPSSPGHAEQRPDPPKETPELETVETSVETFAETPVEKTTKTTTVLEEESKVDNLVENVPLADDVVLATTEPEKEHAENGVEQSPEDKDAASKETEEVQEIRKEEPEAEEVKPIPTIAEVNVVRIGDEDSVSSDCLSVQSQHKRKYEEEDSPTKKLRTQIQQQYVTHDKILSEYIESLGCGTIEDLQIHTDQLLTEIRTLGEMAREKEREWNNILHLKKVKEELLLRLQRKKQVSIMSDKSESDWDVSQSEQDLDKRLDSASCSRQSKTVTVPVASTSPSASTSRSAAKIQTGKTRINQPKVVAMTDQNGGECRQGRQGPILDVRSIIADYRQKNPDTAPRRGRRLKSVLNRNSQDKGASTSNVLSMASLALGSGSQVRQGYASEMSEELGMLLSAMDSARQEHSRPCSADSSGPSAMTSSDFGMSFKDVLLQFARLSQTERQELQAQAAASLSVVGSGNKAPPPPYPEVTLHPVPSTVTIPVTTPQNSSLLHGILTKSQQPKNIDTSKPANFSPTLARLLSTPDRGSNVQQMQQPIYTTAFNAEVSITDLLSSGKSRNEITITPIGQFGQNVKHKHNEHLDEDEAEDSADRLVIDEGGEVGVARADNGSEAGDEVPHCQGCQQKAAQFVCAGCGNQWYCSRDCQVAAWDEHSELCSG